MAKDYHISAPSVKLVAPVPVGYHAPMDNSTVVQIIGMRKNAATRKAIRYFSERGVKAHIVDLGERALAKGELDNIARAIDPGELIDTKSAAYARGGYAYLDFDPIEELLEHPLLMRMPVVRNGNRVTIGEQQAEWGRWLGR